MCKRLVGRAGIANITVLPAADAGGLVVSLRAPAHAIDLLAATVRARDGTGAPSACPATGAASACPRAEQAGTEPRREEKHGGESALAIPPGHTCFSWLGEAAWLGSKAVAHVVPSGPVPPSHTRFSWSASRDGSGVLRLAAGAERAHGTCALIWLHGVGDVGSSWEDAFRGLQSVAGLKCHHPTAPRRPVTALNGLHTAWFDLESWPVGPAEREQWPASANDEAVRLEPSAVVSVGNGDGHSTLAGSVASVHRLLDRIAEGGTPTERVVLGGFSQGGATAIAAGLSYGRRLAGIASISGWCPDRTHPRAHAANASTPVFCSSGTADPVVSFQLAKQSVKALGEVLPAGALTFERVDRSVHPPKRHEMLAATEFIRGRLLANADGRAGTADA